MCKNYFIVVAAEKPVVCIPDVIEPWLVMSAKQCRYPCNGPSADLTNYWKCAVSNRPLPSSKNPHFQNEARCTIFLVKMSFICMRMKNDFHIKGWAPTVVLKQRPGGTRKWPISLQPDWQNDNGPIMARIQILVHVWGPKEVFWRCFKDGLNQAPVAQKVDNAIAFPNTYPLDRLRVVLHFSSGIVERAKRERAWKSPHARKGDTRGFHASSRLASSTIPEEKWGTTCSLSVG